MPEQIKVYVGRRSMCAGDDMNAPNMKSFRLPDSLEAFAAALDRILPFDRWTCYLGYPVQNVSGEEDGVMVSGRQDSRILLSVADGRDTSDRLTILAHAENWHALVQANPYLFCE